MDIEAMVALGPDGFKAEADRIGWVPAYSRPFGGRPSIRQFVPVRSDREDCVFGDKHPVGEAGVLVCTSSQFESREAGEQDGLRDGKFSRMSVEPMRLVYLLSQIPAEVTP